MVVAAREGGDPIGSALRRLGRVRVATKYPRIADAHFSATGRQAEIVEVKGSVELAPLTGLVDGIVDLTATGTHAGRERAAVVGGDRGLHRAPDRQPGGPQAEGGADRRIVGGSAMRIRAAQRVVAARCRASARGRWPRSSPTCARGGDEAVLRLHRALRPGRAGRPSELRVDARELEAAVGVLEPGRARRPAHGDRERARGGGGAAARAGRGRAARGPARGGGRGAGAAARASTCPAGARPTRRRS